MKNTSERPLVLAGLSLLLLLAAQLMVPVAQADEMKLRRQGEYTFISGGLNEEETAFLDAQAPKYPIQLVFRNHGLIDGVKDVNITVRNVKGEAVVEALSRGPYFYVNPPAGGRFTIEAELSGEKLSMTKDLVGRRYLHLVFEFGRDKP